MKRQCHVSSLVFSLVLTATLGCAGTEKAAETETEDKEMISIGYGQIEKENVTGSIGVIDSEDIERRKVTDASSLFEGRIPGVRVVRTADGPRLRIRGEHTFMGSKDPLIVLDGTPLPNVGSGLSFLNPYDIDRIEVLKGPSAAIYGSRGANGVIIITTKR